MADVSERLALRPWSVRRLLLLLSVCLVAWGIVAAGCLMVGSSSFGVPADDIWRVFHGGTLGGVLRFRLEWTIVASLVGACLALAGVTYQAVLRNPLADPYLLGVASGSSLAVFLWTISPLAVFGVMSQQGAAFAGAIVTLMVVFALAQKRGRLEPLKLLLVGVIVNAINGAFYLLLFQMGRSQDIARMFRFLAGGLQQDLQPIQIQVVAAIFFVALTVLLFLSGQLNISTLTEAEAESLGVRIHRLRWVAMITASLVTAAAMAISGPIGFVGLVCPHVGRLLVGNDQRKLVPVAMAMGAILLAVADASCRTLQQVPSLGQLPVGVLTGFLGGPFFLFLLWRSRQTGVAS
jgi:iron complex transport system permease protein